MFDPIVTLTPTVTASATPDYSAGDNLGGLLTLSDATPPDRLWGEIVGVVITSDVAFTSPFDVVFFNANPTGSTFTDNAAQDIVLADQGKVVGVAHCSDVTALSGCSIHQTSNIVLPFRLAPGATLYAAIVIRGTLNLTATDEVKIAIRIRQQQ